MPIIAIGATPLSQPSLILPLVIGIVFTTAGSTLIGYSMDRANSDTPIAVDAMIRAQNSDNPRYAMAYQHAMRRRRAGLYGSLAAALACYGIGLTVPLIIS